MTAAPEDRIREHLERRGGSTRVSVERLLGTWGLADDPSDTNRLLVARALEEVGVIAEPAVETTPVDDDVELRIADARALTRNRRLREEAAAGRRARRPEPEPRPALEPRPTAAPDAPDAPEDTVAIPPALPRMLLATGAVGTIASLFLPWFSGFRGGEEIPELSTGWEWLSVIDGLLLAVALTALALLVLRITDALSALVVAGLGILAAACVAYRIVAPPGGDVGIFVLDVQRDIGPFVALLCLGLLVAGAGLLSPSREGRFLPSGQAPDDPSA
jgi:hypothetical protein